MVASRAAMARRTSSDSVILPMSAPFLRNGGSEKRAQGRNKSNGNNGKLGALEEEEGSAVSFFGRRFKKRDANKGGGGHGCCNGGGSGHAHDESDLGHEGQQFL